MQSSSVIFVVRKTVSSNDHVYNIQCISGWVWITSLDFSSVFCVRDSSSTAGAMEASMFLIAYGSSSLDLYCFWVTFWLMNPHSALSKDHRSRLWGGHSGGTSKFVSEHFVEGLFHGGCITSWGPIILELYLTKQLQMLCPGQKPVC